MKKILLTGTIVAGLMLPYSPANAENGNKINVKRWFESYDASASGNFDDNIDTNFTGQTNIKFADNNTALDNGLTIGGFSRNYLGAHDQDDTAGTETVNFDMQRDTEIHITLNETMDNGLTYGFHLELQADGGNDANTIDESYIFFSGNWGRVNLGSEDGAQFLLQVATPSADSNVDGIRQNVNPVNYRNLPATTVPGFSWANGIPRSSNKGWDGFDYDADVTGKAEKITYITPNFAGLQLGISYTPSLTAADSSTNITSGFAADNPNTNAAADDEAYEVALRYAGEFGAFRVAAGGGMTDADDLEEWNTGFDVNYGNFGFGLAYIAGGSNLLLWPDFEASNIGIDYTVGKTKFGATYFTQEDDTSNRLGSDLDTDRYTIGVVHSVAPGVSFRGSLSHIEHEFGTVDSDATSLLGGIQINF